IVRPAHQANVVGFGASSESERMPVGSPEPVPLGTSPSLTVDEAALASVPPIHGATHLRGEVPRGAHRVRLVCLLWRARLRISPRLASVELPGDDLVDDRGEVAVWDVLAHERAESL